MGKRYDRTIIHSAPSWGRATVFSMKAGRSFKGSANLHDRFYDFYFKSQCINNTKNKPTPGSITPFSILDI